MLKAACRAMSLVITAVVTQVGYCQLTYQDGKAVLDTVLKVDTVPSAVLYERAKEWMLRNLKSADNQVSLDDEARARLIGTTNLLLPKKKYGNIGSYYADRTLNFKLSVFLKEGRYRVIVENIVYSCVLTNGSHREPQQSTMEEYFEYRKGWEAEGKEKRLAETNGTIDDLEGEINKFLTSLHRAMSGDADGTDKDW